jgi:transposase, IS30 family
VTTGYTSLTLEERTQAGFLAEQGFSRRAIANQLGRSASTVCREFSRNASFGGPYRAARSHALAAQRRVTSRARCRKLGTTLDSPLGRHVLGELMRSISPQQIAGRLELMHPDDPSKRVSHETIYSAVYMLSRGELRTQIIDGLRQGHTKRMPRARGVSRKSNIANIVPLAERPPEADDRRVPGHWEGDFVKGARNASAIGTAIERTSRYVLLTQMNGCTATHALEGFSRRFAGVIPELRSSLTYDRGSEMARHEELTAATGMPVYFCDPRSPWQRASNENLNGLLRQFLPKGTDLSAVTPQKLAYIEAMLNDRPRAVLGYKTPREVYTELVQDALASRVKQNPSGVALQG